MELILLAVFLAMSIPFYQLVYALIRLLKAATGWLERR